MLERYADGIERENEPVVCETCGTSPTGVREPHPTVKDGSCPAAITSRQVPGAKVPFCCGSACPGALAAASMLTVAESAKKRQISVHGIYQGDFVAAVVMGGRVIREDGD